MNYEIRINESQLPRYLEPVVHLAATSGDPEFQFAMVCLFASHFVYDLDKEEYIDIDEGAEWIMEHITQIGPKAFNEEMNNKQLAFLKRRGIYVHIIDGRNMNPRNN